jgi:tetratricopeptide (TPR) repeat protein
MMRVISLMLIASLTSLTACASRKPNTPAAAAIPAPPPVDVTALMAHGCFRCLEKALEAASGEQAFEVAALLTLRAKELGLPHMPYRDRAAALVPQDPAFSTYLAVLDAVAADPLSGERYRQGSGTDASATRADRGSASARPLVPAERIAAWREAFKTGPGSDLFRRYLDLAVGCSGAASRDETAGAVNPGDVDPPLLVYRAGICGRRLEQLRALRDGDPEFVDADFTLARYAMGARPADLDEALRRLESVRAAFPDSLAITTALGGVREEREEWTEAVAMYESVLTVMPEHRDALLGRTTSLSRLRRHDDAMASATRMIELGSWFIGEAHYWRAWNLFSLQQYSQARVDADRAKSLMANAAVFVLSGLIEWNERRLPTAESEFEEALKMDFGRCDSADYLGRVRMQRTKVPEAIAAFRQAIQCFDLSITLRQKLIADVQAGPGSEATKSRLIAGHQRAIDQAMKDRDECRQNLTALEKRGTQ